VDGDARFEMSHHDESAWQQAIDHGLAQDFAQVARLSDGRLGSDPRLNQRALPDATQIAQLRHSAGDEAENKIAVQSGGYSRG
jgi:hypothetical protein